MDQGTLDITVSSVRGVRPENQDAAGYLADDGFVIALVCDGIGGMPDGAAASGYVRDRLLSWAESIRGSLPDDLCGAFVGECVSAEEGLMDAHPGSGTTLVAVLYDGSDWYSLHLGDSRCYAIRGDDAHRTADHSPVEAMLKAGLIDRDEVEGHPFSHMVSKFMGGGFASEVEINKLGDWDVLALCSDGAFGYMDEEEFLHYLVSHDASDVTSFSLEKGSRDNVSVVRIERVQP